QPLLHLEARRAAAVDGRRVVRRGRREEPPAGLAGAGRPRRQRHREGEVLRVDLRDRLREGPAVDRELARFRLPGRQYAAVAGTAGEAAHPHVRDRGGYRLRAGLLRERGAAPLTDDGGRVRRMDLRAVTEVLALARLAGRAVGIEYACRRR